MKVNFENATEKDKEMLSDEQIASLEADVVDPLDNAELNEATKSFMTNYARSIALSRNLSRNGLHRVFKTILGFPFEATDTKFKSNAEHELFVLSLAVLAAKIPMTKAVMDEASLKEIAQEATTNVAKDQAQKIMAQSAKETKQ